MMIYSVLGFLRPAVYILLLPFYTSHLTDLEYGLYNLMLDVGAFAMIIASFKISSAMLTYYYSYVHDRSEVKSYLSSSFSASLLIGAVTVGIFYCIGPYIFPLIFKSEEITFFPYGFTAVAYAAMTEAGMVYLTYLKNEKEIIKYSILVFIQLITVVFFQVFLIAYFDMNAYGALLGMVIGWAFVLVSMIAMEKGILTTKINWTMVRKSIKFGIALMPYLIIYWLLLQGGRTFLERESSLELVALFALIMILTRLIILGIEAVVNGLRPFMFDQFALGEQGNKNQIGLLTKMIIIIPLFTVPVIVLVGTNILLFTTNEVYVEIAPYMTLASLVVFAFTYVKLFYQQLIFAKRSDLATALSFVALIFLLLGFYYLIPDYEIWGVLISTLIANIVLSLLFYIAGQKVIHVDYEMRTILAYPIIVFAIIFIIERFMIGAGYSYNLFGLVQFVVITVLLLAINGRNFSDYKLLFMNRNKS